jgi:DNA-binding NarL/FixJ family response regulator
LEKLLDPDRVAFVASGDAEAAVVVATDDMESALGIVRGRRAAGDAHIVLVAPRNDLSPRRALDAGADGVVTLEAAAEALGPTVGAVIAGQVAIPRQAHAQLERPLLSAREKQTLAMVVLGFSNGEIASKLFVSESTVKSHLGSAFKKLDVNSRKQAVARILDPEGGLGTGILSITGTEPIGPAGGDALPQPPRSGTGGG